LDGADIAVSVGVAWLDQACAMRARLAEGSRNAQSRAPQGWATGSWSTSAPDARTLSNAHLLSLANDRAEADLHRCATCPAYGGTEARCRTPWLRSGCASNLGVLRNRDRNVLRRSPAPHFHARYGDHQAQITIATGEVLHGFLPRRALKLVQEWTELHSEELDADWERAEQEQPLASIEPLP